MTGRTVSSMLARRADAGLNWPDIADWDEDRLRTALAPSSIPAPNWRKTDEPDYTEIRRELQTHKHLTLQLLWQEYREKQPNGYGYSRYCGLYRSWLKRQDVVLRHEHRAGEKLFVDCVLSVAVRKSETAALCHPIVPVADGLIS